MPQIQALVVKDPALGVRFGFEAKHCLPGAVLTNNTNVEA
jgi:hypothetical protein